MSGWWLLSVCALFWLAMALVVLADSIEREEEQGR